MFESSSNGLIVMDADGRVLCANEAAAALHWADIERLLFRAPARDTAGFRAELNEHGHAITELRFPREGGRGRHIAVEAKRHGDDHVAVSLRDVTERRSLEEEVRQLRRIESVGYLTASIVHDFNNLLTPIVCLSTVLGHELDPKSRSAVLVNELNAATRRAAGLVRQMLAFVRREPSRPEQVNLSVLVADMRGLLERVVGENVDVALSLDSALGETRIDREQFEHVLLNIAANARDAMPRGGRLTVRTTNVTLREGDLDPVDRTVRGDFVMLTVTDDGVGMSPRVRERIFERFFTTKDVGQGTGLGLATAHSFVTQNGGHIAVRSASGEGTSIAIYLPRLERAPSAAPPPPAHAPLPGGSETILVVEDDQHVRNVLCDVLTQQGYRVLEAATGEAALRHAEAEAGRIDLFLVDAIMPRMNGKALVDALLARGESGSVLFMSGHTDKVLAEHGILEAEHALLRKAFAPSDLLRKVREVLDESPVTRRPTVEG
jgi:signal transduction histidine kinase